MKYIGEEIAGLPIANWRLQGAASMTYIGGKQFN